MKKRLPPIGSLLAFEAAARHLSFKKAAEELNLTPGAISQKIGKLEQIVGVTLFRRTPHQFSLTVHGETYLPAIRQSLQQISVATTELVQHSHAPTLTISIDPSFAVKWLLPRLSDFNDKHPDITVNINTTNRLIDFDREDIDLAIRHGLGDYKGLFCQKLFTENFVPVCSPALLTADPPLRSADDLKHHTLLHDIMGREWPLFTDILGISGVDTSQGPKFSSSILILQAALDGQGVALVRSALVQKELANGSLVQPFDISMPSDFAYYLVYPKTASENKNIMAFGDWIINQTP